MGYYSKKIGGSLAKALEEVADGIKERKDLSEEVDLARVMAERSLKMFEIVCLSEQSVKASNESKHQAIAGAREAISFVAKMVKDLAALEALRENGMLPMDHINLIALQMGDILLAEFGHENAERIQGCIEKMKQIGIAKNNDVRPRIVLNLE